MKKSIVLILISIIIFVIIYNTFNFTSNESKRKLPEMVINDKGDSLLILYYDNGLKKSQCEIKNNKRRGFQTTYYTNGQKQSVYYVMNEQPWGVGEYYSIKGDSLFPGTLFFGKGSFYEYYEDGRIKTQAFYKNSLRDSIWTYFNIDGKVSSKDIYSNGILLKTTNY